MLKSWSCHCCDGLPLHTATTEPQQKALHYKLFIPHTHLFNGPFSGTTQVSQYQKGKTNLDFTEARDSEWQWHQLDHMQVCTSLQTNNHASTPPLSFLQAGCPSCHPTNSVKALKAITIYSGLNKNNRKVHHGEWEKQSQDNVHVKLSK